jgi:hypothetical protein
VTRTWWMSAISCMKHWNLSLRKSLNTALQISSLSAAGQEVSVCRACGLLVLAGVLRAPPPPARPPQPSFLPALGQHLVQCP